MWNWAFNQELDFATVVASTAVTGTTPVVSDPLDMRSHPGKRVAFCIEIDADIAHGCTFAIKDTTVEADGTPEDTTWATAKTNGSLAKFTATGRTVVSVDVQEKRPFLQVTATGDNALSAGTFRVTAVFMSRTGN